MVYADELPRCEVVVWNRAPLDASGPFGLVWEFMINLHR